MSKKLKKKTFSEIINKFKYVNNIEKIWKI